jgi:hypothetical protein
MPGWLTAAHPDRGWSGRVGTDPQAGGAARHDVYTGPVFGARPLAEQGVVNGQLVGGVTVVDLEGPAGDGRVAQQSETRPPRAICRRIILS